MSSHPRDSRISGCLDVRPALGEYVLGALEPGEQALVGEHLAVCEVCRELAARTEDDVSRLSEIGPLATPPASLWEQVERRIDLEREREDEATRRAVEETLPLGSTVIRSMGGEWRDTDVDGVRFKILHEDAAAHRHTVLYQMDPGTAYPPHVHGGAEECFVLSGDLSVGSVRMRTGDYQRVEAGTRHDWQRTEEGCLLLIVCSTEDEME